MARSFQGVALNMVFSCGPAELVRRAKQVGRVGAASDASTPGAVAVLKDGKGTYSFIVNGVAQACAMNGSGGHRSNIPLSPGFARRGFSLGRGAERVAVEHVWVQTSWEF